MNYVTRFALVVYSFVETLVIVAVFLFALVLGWFTFVNPPPKTRPSLETIAWKSGPGTPSLGTSLIATPILAVTEFEVVSYGPISRARGVVPVTKERMDFIGLDGYWYFDE